MPEDQVLGVYFAARYGRREELQGYRSQLEEQGIIVTSHWLSHEPPSDISKLTAADWRQLAVTDQTDVARADALVLFSEEAGGDGGGRQVEFGMALGLNRPVIVVGPVEHLFHQLPEVQVVSTWDDALLIIDALKSKPPR